MSGILDDCDKRVKSIDCGGLSYSLQVVTMCELHKFQLFEMCNQSRLLMKLITKPIKSHKEPIESFIGKKHSTHLYCNYDIIDHKLYKTLPNALYHHHIQS